MKIFDKEDSSWFSKINFVDENNVLLGYDMCEYADWFIDDVPRLTGKLPNIEDYKDRSGLSNYVFDTSYYRRVENSSEDDLGAMVIFRLVHKNKSKDDKFIHLFNCHNGYYGHGFDFTVGEGDPMISGFL